MRGIVPDDHHFLVAVVQSFQQVYHAAVPEKYRLSSVTISDSSYSSSFAIFVAVENARLAGLVMITPVDGLFCQSLTHVRCTLATALI